METSANPNASAREIVVSAMETCNKASVHPWDTHDQGAIILASVLWHLDYGKRHPALKKSTTDIDMSGWKEEFARLERRMQ